MIFAGVFNPVLEKQALSKMDMLRLLGQSAKQSLVGSHGLKGIAEIYKNPIANTWRGFRDMHWAFQGLGTLGVGSAALGGDGGVGQRVGRTVGQVLPFAMMAKGLGPKAPGLVGMMGAQEMLGGGMFVHKGLLERGGEALDKFLQSRPKVPSYQPPPANAPTHFPRQLPQYAHRSLPNYG